MTTPMTKPKPKPSAKTLAVTARRQHRHRRTIALDGYVREDGLVEVEAEIVDVKTYAFPNIDRGVIQAGEPLHHMRIRLAVDDSLTIREAEAHTFAAPYTICPAATAVFANLCGITIAPGWQRAVKKAIGNNHGCTHITQLMGQVGTVVMQTLFAEKRQQERDDAVKRGDVPKPYFPASALLDTCYSYRPESSVVKRLWPEAAKSKDKADSQ